MLWLLAVLVGPDNLIITNLGQPTTNRPKGAVYQDMNILLAWRLQLHPDRAQPGRAHIAPITTIIQVIFKTGLTLLPDGACTIIGFPCSKSASKLSFIVRFPVSHSMPSCEVKQLGGRMVKLSGYSATFYLLKPTSIKSALHHK